LVKRECARADKDKSDTQQGEAYHIAFRAGISDQTLLTYLGKRTIKSLSFNDADRLLCAMNLWELWHTELRDYYENVNLRIVQCARQGCTSVFDIGEVADGDPIRHFCSHECSVTPDSERPEKIKYSSMVCRRGHPRSEHTYISPKTGKSICRECKREEARRRYHRLNSKAARSRVAA
jgi:hypothetical protein